MKFDPFTRTLYTAEGEFLKHLHCPKQKSWQDLEPIGPQAHRMCDHCERTVFDTAELSDDQLVELLRNEPGTCLKVSLHQPNVLILAGEPK